MQMGFCDGRFSRWNYKPSYVRSVRDNICNISFSNMVSMEGSQHIRKIIPGLSSKLPNMCSADIGTNLFEQFTLLLPSPFHPFSDLELKVWC